MVWFLLIPSVPSCTLSACSHSSLLIVHLLISHDSESRYFLALLIVKGNRVITCFWQGASSGPHRGRPLTSRARRRDRFRLRLGRNSALFGSSVLAFDPATVEHYVLAAEATRAQPYVASRQQLYKRQPHVHEHFESCNAMLPCIRLQVAAMLHAAAAVVSKGGSRSSHYTNECVESCCTTLLYFVVSS